PGVVPHKAEAVAVECKAVGEAAAVLYGHPPGILLAAGAHIEGTGRCGLGEDLLVGFDDVIEGSLDAGRHRFLIDYGHGNTPAPDGQRSDVAISTRACKIALGHIESLVRMNEETAPLAIESFTRAYELCIDQMPPPRAKQNTVLAEL